MSFLNTLDTWPEDRVTSLIHKATPHEADRAIAREDRSTDDLAALLSPAAGERLEDMARVAQRLTRQHFGRTIGLYAPIYLSNVCGANCPYCGYAAQNGESGERCTLDMDALRVECASLAGHGFQHVLLLTGEAPAIVPVAYVADAVGVAREFFPSVSVEIYVLSQAEYETLCGRGLEGVTIYAETYHRPTYMQLHQRGAKKDFLYRLDGIERAGKAGVRRLSIGALLGLSDWRLDGFWLGLHARYLQKVCWRSAIAMSFPRLKNTPPGFKVPCPVEDKHLVQLMLAMRLFCPETGFNLSTREPAALRDNLIRLGVTMMSAGSSTRPGGYAAHRGENLEQFAIEDARTPAEVAASLRAAGYDPVWKDFDRAFHVG